MLLKTLLVLALCFFSSANADNVNCYPTDDNGLPVTDSKGRSYDLSALKKKPNEEAWQARELSGKDEYKYLVNVCDRIYSNQDADRAHAAVWQIKLTNESQKYECGDATTGKITLVEDESLKLVYTEGDHCNRANTSRQSVISFVCKRSKPIDNPPTLMREDNCTYYFEWLTPAACPIENPNNGMGAGSVFLIIILVLALIYLLGGVAYNRLVLGMRGVEQIPNYLLWMDMGDRAKASLTEVGDWVRARMGHQRPLSVQADVSGLVEEGSIDSVEEDDERLLES
eukprot:comp18613_c0_seq1/m.20193 comp18613_c0_seq1/g.20193  ORF comp18613_c0_seq1/g.20193 comp18613_c0_seq1/m.20193 type:complete len:284 (-) comp18613_c0_seq1:142-993(-)